MSERNLPGVTFDEALRQRLIQAKWSRREFLARVAAFGAATALTQLLIACGQAGASPTAAPPTTAATPEGTTTAVATATPAPTAVPTPEKELFVYNWDGYIGEKTVQKFHDKYGINVKYDLFPDENTQITTLQKDGKGGGYDVSYPASTWMPSFIQDGIVRQIDHSLIPNLANLSAAWQNPGYDPNNQYSVPNYWWTTGFAWDPKKVPGNLTTWDALFDPASHGHIGMLDDQREVFAVAGFKLGIDPNTTDEAQLDQMLNLLEQQKPLLRKYTDDDIGDMTSGNLWISHAWSGDWYQMIADKPSIKYVIPTTGAVRGNDTMVVLSGAPHPIAAQTWINFNLDPQISAGNTNYIGYMGPNAAAEQYIDDAIKGDPRLNPPQAVIDKLVELIFLPPTDLDKYTQRWNALRA